MFSRISRNFVGLTLWIIFTLGFFFIAGVTGLGNYLGTTTSLDLLGYDRMPLWMDKLIGPFFRVFLGEATVSHLLALGLTLSIAAGWFFETNIIFHLYSLFLDRRQYIKGGNQENAQAVVELMIADVLMMVVIGIPLLFACRWDIGLWHYRSAVAALGIEDSQTAVQTVPAWKIFLNEHGGLFAPNAARFGGWGYISVTALSSIGLEFAFRKVSEYWIKLCQAFSDLWNLDSAVPDYADSDDPDPIQAEDAAEAWEPASDPGIATETYGHRVGRITDDQPQQTSTDEPQEIIGGNGKSVRFSDAISDARYWVDPVTREIWDANLRNSLRDS